ncbi:MAG: aminoglycoside phosphotransferase family protein [Ornithinimicrobium sp.]
MTAGIVTKVELGTRTGPIDLLLNEHWLTELVGHPVQARRIRHKPGVGAVASYGATSGAARGWVQLVQHSAQDKVENAERRAADRDRTVTVRSLPRGWTAVHGEVATDPRLHRALDQLPTELVDGLREAGEVRLLRYNPHRRLVLRWAETVLRVTVDRQTTAVAGARALANAGICVSQPVRMPGLTAGRRVTAWPWVAGVDLLAGPDPQGALAAGDVLARWHARPVSEAPAALRCLSPKAGLRGTLAELAVLDPPLAVRVRPVAADLLARITRECAEKPRRWSHGDFSADQLIRPPGGGAQVIDLDRSTLAPVGFDLGSFCAVERLRRHQGSPAADLSDSFLRGYAVAGGALPAPESLRDWTAYGLLTRLTEPMRQARPEWRVGISQRWVDVQKVLAT